MKRTWENKSLLIIDDDSTSIFLFEEYLSETEVIVFSAQNKEEAMTLLEKHPIDVILMDIQLQDISGFILISQIRNLYPNIPIIAETAFASNEDKRKCISSGFNGFLSKPIFLDSLLLELDKYLN